jgi:hypothetical protein
MPDVIGKYDIKRAYAVKIGAQGEKVDNMLTFLGRRY